jgi:endonuclease/exonuclease/phosphatase family metal-dependent hydrolase
MAARQLRDQTAEIAGLLNRYHWYHGAMEADASEVGVDGKIVNRRRSFGNAVISRWPIAWARGHLLPKEQLVGCVDLQRGFVEAAIDTPSGPLRGLRVHLSHIGPQQRLPQVRSLMDTIINAERIGRPGTARRATCSCSRSAAPTSRGLPLSGGDFNFTSAHPEYPLVCGEMSVYGRLGTTQHLADAWFACWQQRGGRRVLPERGVVSTTSSSRTISRPR